MAPPTQSIWSAIVRSEFSDPEARSANVTFLSAIGIFATAVAGDSTHPSLPSNRN